MMKTNQDSNLNNQLQSNSYGEQLEAIFQAFPDLLFRMDASGKILEYRVGDPSHLYASPEDFLGKRLQDVLPPEVIQKYNAAITQMQQTHKVVSFDYFLKISGRKFAFEARLVQLPGSIILAIIRDITNQKNTSDKLQHQLHQMAALRSIDTAISSSYDLNLTMFVILTQVTEQLRIDAADILLLSPQGHTLDFVGARGFRNEFPQPGHLEVGEGFAGQIALGKRMHILLDLGKDGADLFDSAIVTEEKFVCAIGVPLIAKGKLRGVLELFNRSSITPDEEWFTLLDTLAKQASIAIDNASVMMELQQSNRELALAYDATIEGWSRALELRDCETHGHAERVTLLTVRMARLAGMDEEQIVHVRRGALLHDIGKMGLPDSILLKKGPLTMDEIDLMHKHPLYAMKMLSTVPHLRPAMDIPVYHHEKWDGTGYPYGLQGEQIPLAARIFVLADVYDALASDRPYRKAWVHREAISYIRNQSGSHFDPSLVPMALREFQKDHPVKE